MLTEVAQARPVRQRVAGQIVRRQREQHLSTMGGGQQARESIETRSEVVPIAWLAAAVWSAIRTVSGSSISGPRLRCQRPLGIERRGDGVRGGGEGGLDRVATTVLKSTPPWASMAARRSWKWRSTAGRHRLLVPLPERGAALDVGEEEGDGAGGEIGHGPLPTSLHTRTDDQPRNYRLPIEPAQRITRIRGWADLLRRAVVHQAQVAMIA